MLAVEVISSGKNDFNCHECDDQLKQERGCDRAGTVPFYIENERYFRCPLKLIDKDIWKLFEAYKHYKYGILPNYNNWNDESEKFLQLMILLEAEYNNLEIKQVNSLRNKNA